MKKLLSVITYAIILTSTCLLINSCTKEKYPVINDDLNSSLFSQARSWHRNHTAAYNSHVSSVSKTKSKVLQPLWDQASTGKLSDGSNVIIIPAKEFKLTNRKFSLVREFVFSEKHGKITDGKIVEFYGLPDFISANKDYLISRYKDGLIEKFDGTIITYNVNYGYLQGAVYKKGIRIQATVSITSIKQGTHTVAKHVASISSKNRIAPTIILNEGNCYDRYMVTTYPDGSQDYEYMYTWCEGGGEDYPPGGGGGDGGGGDAGDGTPDPNDPIITETIQAFANDIELDEEDYETVFTASTEPGPAFSPVPLRIKPTFVEVKRYQNSRIIISIVQHPLAPDPVYAYYVDKYGRQATRYVVLTNQSYNYQLISSWVARLNWSCLVNKRYTYSDGQYMLRQNAYNFTSLYQ